MNKKQFKKKRIHEVDYAQKVLNSIKPHIQNTKLNQNLFHAQQITRHSSTIIKDIQKDVRQTLRKYDSQIKLSESNRNHTITDSTRKYSNEIPRHTSFSPEKELNCLKQQQRILMALLNNLQNQENLTDVCHQSSEKDLKPQCIKKQTQKQNEKQIQYIEKKKVQIDQPQKKIYNETDVISLDLSKLKKSPNNKSISSFNFFVANNKDKQNSNIPVLTQNKSCSKFNLKNFDQQNQWENYGVANNKNKQHLKYTKKNQKDQINNENKLQTNGRYKQGLERKSDKLNPRDSHYDFIYLNNFDI
ncbi:unnamed protein product [Paramecium primaurelia]|uniref:Uncharacterized protein n=1 Tax=Paramecium primaurelia TaxID=5886 RepID=A0A8S1MCT2_PARPR|nr:unnamed protein product [Paramecium primaurelia]